MPPTASCSAMPWRHGSSANRSTRCWRPTPRSPWPNQCSTMPSRSSVPCETHITSLKPSIRWNRNMALRHIYSGKVRDVYEVDERHLLFVASDRISAFDVVMAEPIPDKGRVLTAMTAFWLEHVADITANHLVSLDPPSGAGLDDLAGRSMVVRKAEMLPIECIVRGYLSG